MHKIYKQTFDKLSLTQDQKYRTPNENQTHL